MHYLASRAVDRVANSRGAALAATASYAAMLLIALLVPAYPDLAEWRRWLVLVVVGVLVSLIHFGALKLSRYHQLAQRDSLTGVANRSRAEEELLRVAARARRRMRDYAVLYLDIDDFKSINDQFGHIVGDKVLREVANRLQLTTRPGDLVARIGGDEFLIVTEDAKTRRSVVQFRERIREAMSSEITVGRGRISVSLSIGARRCSYMMDPEKLIGDVDRRMYRAKRIRQNPGVALSTRLVLERDLSAVRDGQVTGSQGELSSPSPGRLTSVG